MWQKKKKSTMTHCNILPFYIKGYLTSKRSRILIVKNNYTYKNGKSGAKTLPKYYFSALIKLACHKFNRIDKNLIKRVSLYCYFRNSNF